jgi:hypothetical protein
MEDLAEKNKERAERRFDTASEMASFIPLGQPILIGHHSEKRDRNFRGRIHSNIMKGVELQKKSDYYSERASAAAANDAIMSDDPEALKKLAERIKTLEEGRDAMKAVNKAWRKAGKPKLDDVDGWQKVANDPSVTVTPEVLSQVRRSMALTPWQGQPYASYSFQNLSANIKRLKLRLVAMIEAEKQEAVAFEIGGVRVEEEDGRINVYFPGKPSEDTRKRLKSYPLSLKWSPRSGCWTRKMTTSTGRYFVESLKELCSSLPS